MAHLYQKRPHFTSLSNQSSWFIPQYHDDVFQNKWITMYTGLYPEWNGMEQNRKESLRWRHNECDDISNYQLAIVYSNVYSGVDQRKHQSSTSLAFMRAIHQWTVNSPHKGPVTRKIFSFDDVIIYWCQKQASQLGISNCIPQYSYPCLRYLLLVPKSQYRYIFIMAIFVRRLSYSP